MGVEIDFALKVLRNGFILSALYFASVWASVNELNLTVCKPIILFLIFYVCTELAKRYGIDYGKQIPKVKKPITLIL